MASCEPCARKEKHSPAVKECVECEEPLCQECCEAHRTMKALLTHRIIDTNSVKTKPMSALMKPSNQFCKKHNSSLEYFCSFHENVCCQACMSQHHRTCAQVLPINVVAKGSKHSRNTEELLSQLRMIHGTLNEMKQKKLHNIEKIKEQDAGIRNTTVKLRQKVSEHLNVIEKELHDELSVLKKASTIKLEKEAKKFQQSEELVKSFEEHIQFEKQHGSDKQTFLAVQMVKDHIIGIEEKILQAKSRAGTISIVFRENGDILESLNSFGSLSLSSNTTTSTKNDVHPNNTDQDGEKLIGRFEFDYKFNASIDENVMITGMAVTDDNRLLLCGGGKQKIVIYTQNGKYLQDCKTAGEPWDVEITRDRNSKAVVTLPYLYALQFINTGSMVAGKMVKFEWRVYGVTSTQKNIIVGGRNCLHILDMEGTKLNNISVPSVNVFYIHPRENGDFYYSDSSFVYCVKPDGRHIFCKDLVNLESPRNIATDNKGNLYVAGHRSENVHRLTPEGISMDVLLSKEDGLDGPFALCFSKDQSTLFVSNNNGRSITAYSTVYAPPSKEDEIKELLRYL